MPGFNRRGPAGQGPMSGRRMGRCTQFGNNEKAMNAELPAATDELPNHTPPFGHRRGRTGGGRGFAHRHGRANCW
ncbi:MAG: DUF5320 domain-containing protein [Bacteroidales bacterium]|nr:DUF5320 domain-containing protein [Bacteroidales bacterium]